MQKRLSPLSLQQIVEQSFIIYRDNLVPFIGVTAVIAIPMTLISLVVFSSMGEQLVITPAPDDGLVTELPSGIWILFALTIIDVFLQGVVVSGLITYMSSESHLGRQITFLEGVAAVQDRLLTLAAAFGGLIALFFFVFIVLTFLTLLLFFPVFAFPVVAYLGTAVYFFLVPVIVLERVDVRLGVNRALGLGKWRFWSALALLGGTLVLTGIISQVLIAFGQFLTGIDASNDFAYTMLNAIVQIIFAPLPSIALTVMYYDTRVRFETLSEALATAEAESVADVPSPPIIDQSNRLLGTPDITNIVMFTLLLFVGLFFLGPILGLILGIPPA